jgi:hypothetical protein
MSNGDGNRNEFEQNPHSAPHLNPQWTPPAGTIPMPPNQTRGMVNQAAVVGVLMAVQGAMNCVAGLISAFYAALMPLTMQLLQRQAAQQAGQNGGNAPVPMPENIGWYFAIGGTLVAVVLIGLGVLLIYTGFSVARYQRRTLAMIALGSGLITLFTCYCFPTSLALAVYGMIFLLNQPVSLAFDLRSQGHSAPEIQRAFLALP